LPLSGAVCKTCSEGLLIPDSLPLAYNYIKVIPKLQPNVSQPDETVLPQPLFYIPIAEKYNKHSSSSEKFWIKVEISIKKKIPQIL